MSEQKTHYKAFSNPASIIKSRVGSQDSIDTIVTKMGASEIKRLDLPSLILGIFDEEYAVRNISQIAQARSVKPTNKNRFDSASE